MRTSTGFAATALIASMLAPWTTDNALAVTEGKTVQGGRFVSGGVALDEREALDARRADFSLWVATAAKKTGSYLAEVRVKVTDPAGKTVLDTKLDGPWLLVDLKPGRYAIEAGFRGQTQSKTTNIRKGEHREMLFYFDLAVETLPPGAKG